MFQSGDWFAWYPVRVKTMRGQRVAWLETVYRERFRTSCGTGAWRYYAI